MPLDSLESVILHSYWSRETDPSVNELRQNLDKFYATTTEYAAFNEVSQQEGCWAKIVERLHDHEGSEPVRVLEFGAGRSGFGRYLGELRPQVKWTVQDITPVNRDFLDVEADHVHIGDVNQLSGQYHVIFSTFVWEHITNPLATLEHLISLLKPSGSLFLFSPRYDLPGYVPPALRHHSKFKAQWITLRLWADRQRVRLGGQPGFWIVTDPALLHTEQWFRDSDAIHLVSLADLRSYLSRRGVLRLCKSTNKGWLAKIRARTQLAVEWTQKPFKTSKL